MFENETEKLSAKWAEKWAEIMEKSPVKEFEKNAKAMRAAFFDKLDLVTREEFDVQQEVLLHLSEKVVALEAKVAALEAFIQTSKTQQDNAPS